MASRLLFCCKHRVFDQFLEVLAENPAFATAGARRCASRTSGSTSGARLTHGRHGAVHEQRPVLGQRETSYWPPSLLQ